MIIPKPGRVGGKKSHNLKKTNVYNCPIMLVSLTSRWQDTYGILKKNLLHKNFSLCSKFFFQNFKNYPKRLTFRKIQLIPFKNVANSSKTIFLA
jgi:hypothetical protein